jgi:hypothetical protein
MKKQLVITTLILVLGLGTVAAADDTAPKFWVMPTVGVRSSGSFGISSEDLAYTSIHFSDGFAYGLSFGYRVSPMIAFEAMWSRHSSNVAGQAPASADGTTPAVNEPLFKAIEDQFQANFLLSMGYLVGKVKPYFLFGLGLTNFNPEGDLSSVSRFAWSFGVGAEASIKDWLGLRFQGKFVPTYINTTEEILIEWDGGYQATPMRNNITQWEFQAGLVFRF